MDNNSKLISATNDEPSDTALDDIETGENKEQRLYRSLTVRHLKDVIDIAFKVVLIAAAAVGWLEYVDRQHETKIRYSLQIVDDWEDERYVIDFRKFNAFSTNLLEVGKVKYPDNKQSSSRFASNKLDDSLRSENNFKNIFVTVNGIEKTEITLGVLRNSIERLNYFYSKVGLCVRNEICQPDLMQDYFSSSSCYFYDMLQTHINRMRIDDENFEYAKFTEYFCKNSR